MKYTLPMIICLFCLNTAWPGIGPFEISDKDSSTQLRFQFAGQLRTQYESKDAGSGKERTEKFFTEARRVRLTFTVKLPQRHLSFKLHLSTAPGSLELMDAQFDYQLRSGLQLRFGQYKVPFTRYRIQSFQRLTFADWAIVTKYFGAERQIGASLHNGYEKPPRWGYVVGVFTGVNARASHGLGLAPVYGEETANPSDLTDPGPKAEYHPEIFAHASFNTGGIDVQSDTDEKREGLRTSVSFSAAWDVEPVEYQDLFVRLSPEILMKYRGLSFSGIGYAGFVRMGCPKIDRLGISGGLVQSAYRINTRFEISARYALVDFETALIDDAYSRAKTLIAEAQVLVDESEEQELALMNLADIKAQYKNAGKIIREEETTFGFNIYWEGHSLKMQNDAGWLIHTRRDEIRTDFMVRSQFQLTF